MKPPRITLSVTLIVLSIFSLSSVLVHSLPSGQTSSIEGGGFCQGTYTVYNNTIDNLLYGENCSTGVNDCSLQTDLGALLDNCVFTNMARGGLVHLRTGFYGVSTPVILSTCIGAGTSNYCDMGLTLEGSGSSHTNGLNANFANATVLVAKTNNVTMIQATAQSPHVFCSSSACTGGSQIQSVTLRDFTVFGNGLAAVGIDLSTTSSVAVNNWIERIFFTNLGGSAPGFLVALRLQGQEETFIRTTSFDGAGTVATRGANIDVQWFSPGGDLSFVDIPQAGGVLSYAVSAQKIVFDDSVVNSIKIIEPENAATQILDIDNSYLANIANVCFINLNGQSVSNINIRGSYVVLSVSLTMFCGTGSVNNMIFSGNEWHMGGGTWNANAATLTKQGSDGSNNTNGGALPAGFPFPACGVAPCIDANHNF